MNNLKQILSHQNESLLEEIEDFLSDKKDECVGRIIKTCFVDEITEPIDGTEMTKAICEIKAIEELLEKIRNI